MRSLNLTRFMNRKIVASLSLGSRPSVNISTGIVPHSNCFETSGTDPYTTPHGTAEVCPFTTQFRLSQPEQLFSASLIFQPGPAQRVLPVGEGPHCQTVTKPDSIQRLRCPSDEGHRILEC